jgi:hypothetical protein
MGAIKSHRLNAEWAFHLITAVHCDICQRPYPTNVHGRRMNYVEHDHACCPTTSCGHCVRGIVCGSCNRIVASAEVLLADPIMFDKVRAYLAAGAGGAYPTGSRGGTHPSPHRPAPPTRPHPTHPPTNGKTPLQKF